jgi:hypothetical protein
LKYRYIGESGKVKDEEKYGEGIKGGWRRELRI